MAQVDQVIAVAMAQRGKPYVFGAAGPNSFDCSGLVVYAFKNGAGISLPHFTGSLWSQGSAVSKADIRAGDLVFPNPSHVGIAISHTQIVVAPHTGTVVQVQNIGTVWGVRRIIGEPGTGVTDTTGGLTNVDLPGQEQARQVAALFGLFTKINDAFKYMTDPGNLIRAGLYLSGGVLIAIGIFRWEGVSNAVQSGAKAVGKAVKSSGSPK